MSTVACPVWAGEVFEISLAERKPLCSAGTQTRCWHTRIPVWQYIFDADKTLIIVSPDSHATPAAGVAGTLVVRLPGLFVPFILGASIPGTSENDSPLRIRLTSRNSEQTTDAESFDNGAPPTSIEFRQATRHRVLNLEPGNWQALTWRTRDTPMPRRAGTKRHTQDKPDFYFKVRLHDDNLSH